MYVVFEENRLFRLGEIVEDRDSFNLSVLLSSGRCIKLKKSLVMLSFAQLSASQSFLEVAQQLSTQIDLQLLWECSPEEESPVAVFAHVYFGGACTAHELMATLYVLHAHPTYFYRKHRGSYKKAPQKNVEAAQLGAQRKKQQLEAFQQDVALLSAHQFPPLWHPQLDRILFAPDAQCYEEKVLSLAARQNNCSVPELLCHCGILTGPHDFYTQTFLKEQDGRFSAEPFTIVYPSQWHTWPQASVQAISIDDYQTDEIDDAFSVTPMAGGLVEIGIHIAAPAVLLDDNPQLREHAQQRFSTVYTPGDKIRMLPGEVISHFSLDAGQVRPVVSLYVLVDCATWGILRERSCLEQVLVSENLRTPCLEDIFHAESVNLSPIPDYPWFETLLTLYRFAQALQDKRQVRPLRARLDYSFCVKMLNDQPQIDITARQRGSVVDVLVSELMILVNTRWADFLKQQQYPCVFRGFLDNKVRLGLQAMPHASMGLDIYAWLSSPLRRYVDLVNQWQLIAVLSQQPPRAVPDDFLSVIAAFELTYSQYDTFQRKMEKYWSLVWLDQRKEVAHDCVIGHDGLVFLQEVPVSLKPVGLGDRAYGATVMIKVESVDLWHLSVRAQVVDR